MFDAYGGRGYRWARRLLAPDGLSTTTVPSLAILPRSLWTRWFGRRRATIAFTGLRPAERVAEAYRHVERGKRGHVVLTLD
ncbi:hypothetical protein [Nocardiopsis sp. MG754419]|uniref:hypothetical protein n=1 Tax=Nocardiopsis sp. MG754419 TaxID=2259865 RepID=UPI001BAA7768|nr:hypothetical protein [Nocardiopsis sp. MG754419]MBR8740831.1 hypothetical protein [Nocardiopsis sp. MG754419]